MISTEASGLLDQTQNTLRRIFRLLSYHAADCLPFMKIDQLSKEDTVLGLAIQVEVSLKCILKRTEEDYHHYQEALRNLEQKLREHAKLEIELKLYYEHLENIVDQFRAENKRLSSQITSMSLTHQAQIDQLQAQITSRNQTEVKPKTDTISQIKNKILFMDFGDYREYAQERQTLSHLNSKRDSLAKEIRQIYQKEKPTSAQQSLNSSFKEKTEQRNSYSSNGSNARNSNSFKKGQKKKGTEGKSKPKMLKKQRD